MEPVKAEANSAAECSVWKTASVGVNGFYTTIKNKWISKYNLDIIFSGIITIILFS